MNIPIELLKVLKSINSVKENNIISKYFFLNKNAFYFSDNNFAIQFIPIDYESFPLIVFNYDALMDAIKRVKLSKVIDVDFSEKSFVLLTETKKPMICRNIIAEETSEVIEYKDKVVNNIMAIFYERKEKKSITTISYDKSRVEIYYRVFSAVRKDLVEIDSLFMEGNVFIQNFFCGLYTVRVGMRTKVCKEVILI